jgi:hypothetical protein
MTATHNELRYDRDLATRLIPLLEVLVGEFLDRTQAVRSLRRELHNVLGPDGHLPETQPERREASEMRARLSTQLRECRLVTDELEALDCVFDHRRRMVRIPGESGNLEDGFEWYLGSSEVISVSLSDLANT